MRVIISIGDQESHCLLEVERSAKSPYDRAKAGNACSDGDEGGFDFITNPNSSCGSHVVTINYKTQLSNL